MGELRAVVVMDHLRCHQVDGVRAAVEGAGCRLLYLPPNSPDLNPIEQVFAKAMGELRKRKPRTVADTERLCGDAFDWFPPDECRNYISYCGYAKPTKGS